jgi:hypothetical protein
MRLAVSSTEAFGSAVYAEFLKHGVTGMPDINGRPASEFDPKGRLPYRYGAEFGSKIYKMLLARFRNPALVEDSMSSFMYRFLKPGGAASQIQPGTSLKVAENLILKSVTNETLNNIKAQGRRRENSLVHQDDGDDVVVDINDMEAMPNMDRELLRHEFNKKLPKIRHKLEAIHPSAPQYIELALTRGLDDKEIVGSPRDGIPSMLDHPFSNSGAPLSPQSWDATYKPKILAVLKTVFAG